VFAALLNDNLNGLVCHQPNDSTTPHRDVIDLMVSDYKIPGMSGMELAKAL